MALVMEIAYNIDEGIYDEKFTALMKKVRAMNNAGRGPDDVRLHTKMKIFHHPGINHQEATEMGLTPEEDHLDINISVRDISAFYPDPEDKEFVVAQIYNAKYLIRFDYEKLVELRRLLFNSPVGPKAFSQLQRERREDGSISDKGQG